MLNTGSILNLKKT